MKHDPPASSEPRPAGSGTLRGATLVEPDRIRRATLHVTAGRITAARPAHPDWELDLEGHLIFPGLVNAHDHLHLNSIPRLPQTRAFPNSYEWIAAFESHLADREMVAARSVARERRYLHGGLKNLLCGATLVAHHDPWHETLDDPTFPVRLLREFGWAHSLGLGLEARRLGRSPYGPPVVASFRATSAERPWILHLAEGTDAVAAQELAELESLGCLAANSVLVHGVGMSADDVARVVRLGAGVIWCPGSNLSLLGRTLDPRSLCDAGRLALGSDSRLSGGRDLLEELRVAAAHSDLTPRELLRLVTADAARVLRVPAAGGLDIGQYADLVVLRDDGGDPYRRLLASGRSELRAVVVGGMPALGDPDLAAWFAASGLKPSRVTLDGRPKLLTGIAPEVAALEPGLEPTVLHG